LGFGWYVWSSIAQSGPHGHTPLRYVLTHSIFAGALGGYLFAPQFMVYSAFMGAFFGTGHAT
jgi:hypothetical protein